MSMKIFTQCLAALLLVTSYETTNIIDNPIMKILFITTAIIVYLILLNVDELIKE